jgi:hypothetical protein
MRLRCADRTKKEDAAERVVRGIYRQAKDEKDGSRRRRARSAEQKQSRPFEASV